MGFFLFFILFYLVIGIFINNLLDTDYRKYENKLGLQTWHTTVYAVLWPLGFIYSTLWYYWKKYDSHKQ